MVVGDDDHQTSLVGEGERSRDVDAVVDYLTWRIATIITCYYQF